MQAYVGEVFRRQCGAGETIVLALDQSKLNDGPRGLDAISADAGPSPPSRLACAPDQRTNWMARAT